MSQMPRRSFPNDTRIGKALGGGVLVTVGAWIAGESSLPDHSLLQKKLKGSLTGGAP